MQRQLFKKNSSKLALGSTVLIFILAAGLFLFYDLHIRINAATIFSADAVLGHTDDSGNPSFDLNLLNNGRIGPSTFDRPSGMALDASGHRLFVTDQVNQRILVFNLDSTNHFTAGPAVHVIGQSNFSATIFGTNQHNLINPLFLTYDSANKRLFVADQGNNRVLIFNADPAAMTDGENADHVLGQPDFTTGFCTRGQNLMCQPGALALDSANNRLFVSDSVNSRVLVFNVNPAAIADGENADFVLGQQDFVSAIGQTDQNHLNFPAGLFYDSAGLRLFVADQSNNRVLVFNADPASIANGENADHVLGQPDFVTNSSGSTAAIIFAPSGITYDPNTKRLFVSDTNNDRVLIFNANPASIADGENADHVLGQSDFTSNGSSGAAQNKFFGQTDIAYDSANNLLFVVDNNDHRILLFTGAGTITDGENAAAVLGQPDFTSMAFNGENVSAIGMWQPGFTAVDPIGHRLFVSDTNNNRILIFNLTASNKISSTTAVHVLGQPDFKTTDQNTTQNTLANPAGLAYDHANERLFVGDFNNNRVLIFNVDPATLADNENAVHIFGQQDYFSSVRDVSQSGLRSPYGLTYDSGNKRLFVADYANSRVLVFNADPATLADNENADHVLGQPDFVTRDGLTDRNVMNFPQDVAYDSANKRLFVVDTSNNRVLDFNADPATIADGENADHVLGQPDFVSSASDVTQNSFSFPGGAAYDPTTQHLLIADTSNSRILAFDAAPGVIADGENADNVIGQADYVTANFVAGISGLSFAQGIFYDPADSNLMVADSGNQRVVEFNFVNNPSAGGGSGGGGGGGGGTNGNLNGGAIDPAFAIGSPIYNYPTSPEPPAKPPFSNPEPSKNPQAAAPLPGAENPHPDGTLVSDNGTIYLLKGAARFAFRNQQEFQTWGFDPKTIVPSNAADRELHLEGILKAADGTLARSPGKGTIYVIAGGKKHAFKSLLVFKTLGYKISNIINLNLSDYANGAPVSSASAAHPEGSLIQSGRTIYRILDGKLRPFASQLIFESYNFRASMILPANAADLKLLVGPEMGYREGTLAREDAVVYIISDGTKRPFVSERSFLGAGYDFNNVIDADLSGYVRGKWF